MYDREEKGTFMEGYVMEGFTASGTAEECIRNVYNYAELLRPFRNFYLCLKTNWQDTDDMLYEGYPETMLVRAAKPYTISASIGCAVFPDCREISLDNALSEADERMYRYKVKNRRHRGV